MILAGDVGGTNTRLALFERAGAGVRALFERDYADASFANFESLLARFLEHSRAALGPATIERAVLGAAGPVEARRVHLTNRPWTLDAPQLANLLGVEPILLNDFEAAAQGLELLRPAELRTLQAGVPQPGAAQVVIGAGTGLGVAYRIHCGGRYRVIAGEGGHAGFAPADEEQLALARWLHARLGRAAAEDVVSGPGLARIYAYLREGEGRQAGAGEDGPAAISARALEGSDPAATRALQLFVRCYGAVAGDHALAVRAAGGVYVAGGVARRILPQLESGGFISAFNAKRAHAHLAVDFPVYAVLSDRLGLLGAASVATSTGS